VIGGGIVYLLLGDRIEAVTPAGVCVLVGRHHDRPGVAQ
jgi:hypothetical protein